MPWIIKWCLIGLAVRVIVELLSVGIQIFMKTNRDRHSQAKLLDGKDALERSASAENPTITDVREAVYEELSHNVKKSIHNWLFICWIVISYTVGNIVWPLIVLFAIFYLWIVPTLISHELKKG